MQQHYVDPLVKSGIAEDTIIAFSLDYNEANKAPVALMKPCITNTLAALVTLKTKTLIVADAHYFKRLTGAKKADANLGYVLPCVIKGYTHLNVLLTINYQAIFYNPTVQDKLDLSLVAVTNHLLGTYKEIGKDIIHSDTYPTSYDEISSTLEFLHNFPELTVDIEAFSLQFWKAGIGSIGFAWDQHNGTAFLVDYVTYAPLSNFINLEEVSGIEGEQVHNIRVKALLRDFFVNYKGKLIFHNIGYDAKVLIYELYMTDQLDLHGMLYGIEVMTRHFEDTKLITYLATNTTAGNNLKLKDQSHEFAGNYAQSDIKDIRLIPEDKLLTYNLTDCLSTWYVYNKHRNTLIEDQQEEVYNDIFLPSVPLLLQMELTGMPMNMDNIRKADVELRALRHDANKRIHQSSIIQKFTTLMRKQAWTKKNSILKTKVKPLSDFDDVVFNPGSPKQLQELLYEFLGFEATDFTKSKQPATGAKVLKKLSFRSDNQEAKDLLNTLIEFTKVDKIITTFIKAFLNNTVLAEDGTYYLYGNFNLGGTVSGRLSSSNVNLQNLPSGGTPYAKIVKACFIAPPGWLFGGADFSSLEDRISALTTKDSNKLKVYTDHYDGHCLRAFSYFPDRLPGIMDTVDSINSIADKFPEVRQDSKEPTFLLTYRGTHHGLVNTVGMPVEVAKAVEANYHELYKESDAWVDDKLKQAHKDGYVTVAFGMRLRTPIMKQTLYNLGSTPY